MLPRAGGCRPRISSIGRVPGKAAAKTRILLLEGAFSSVQPFLEGVLLLSFEKARELLDRAMAMPVTDEAANTVRRRWAQAYVELGEVEKAVEHLDDLLSIPSLVSVHSLESRLSWAPIRDEPAFQELLARYR